MIWYIVGIVILVIIIIVCFFVLKYLSKEEKNFLEVSNRYLKNIGKGYTKEQYAEWAFNTYNDIIMGVQNEKYNYLRDILADDLYNNYLLAIKNEKDRKVKNVVSNLKSVFSKLVNLTVNGDMEIAKVWLKVSYSEYLLDVSPIAEDNVENVNKERVISGSKDRKIEKEYILTFVKTRTDKESIACPHCGFITHIVYQNICVRCGSTIVNKKYHWVLVGKEERKSIN